MSGSSFQPRIFSFAAGLVVAFLIAVLTSVASPEPAVGVAHNNAFMTPDRRALTTAADLGLDTIRLKPGQMKLTAEQQRAIRRAVARGRR